MLNLGFLVMSGWFVSDGCVSFILMLLVLWLMMIGWWKGLIVFGCEYYMIMMILRMIIVVFVFGCVMMFWEKLWRWFLLVRIMVMVLLKFLVVVLVILFGMFVLIRCGLLFLFWVL